MWKPESHTTGDYVSVSEPRQLIILVQETRVSARIVITIQSVKVKSALNSKPQRLYFQVGIDEVISRALKIGLE